VISVSRPQSPVSHLPPHVVALFSNDLKHAPHADATPPHVVALFSNDLKPAPRADVISTTAHLSLYRVSLRNVLCDEGPLEPLALSHLRRKQDILSV
jgi:hypothetical protein